MSDARTIIIRPAPGERVETTLLLPTREEAVICGQVLSGDGEPACGVLAVLFSEKSGSPIDHTITDEAGRFCFGALQPEQLYIIHLHEKHRNVRVLEVAL